MGSKVSPDLGDFSVQMLNPFIHRLELSIYDKIKVILMTFTILPLRMVTMFILLTLAWLLAFLGLLCVSPTELYSQPMTGWRKKYLKPCILFMLRMMFYAGGWTWVMKGKQASSKEAPILTLAPHSSVFDVLPVVLLGGPSVVAKAEAEQTPFFGTLINYTQPVYVSRESPESRQKAIDDIQRRAVSQGIWDQVLIFPEGTCTNRSCLISFKPGAFYPGVPVQPVCIKYSNQVDSLTWTWEGPGALKILWLTLCQTHNFCEVQYLPVYTPNEAEKTNPKLYANNVREVMARALNVPLSCYFFDDIRHLMVAKEKGIPRTVALVKIMKMRHKNGFKSSIPEEIEKISQKELNGSPCCKETELATVINTEATDAFMEMFGVLDLHKSSKVDVRTYLCGLWLLNATCDIWERLQKCFEVTGQGSHHLIGQKELAIILWLFLGLPASSSASLLKKLGKEDDAVLSFDDFKSCLLSCPMLWPALQHSFPQLLEQNQQPLLDDESSNTSCTYREKKIS